MIFSLIRPAAGAIFNKVQIVQTVQNAQAVKDLRNRFERLELFERFERATSGVLYSFVVNVLLSL